MAELSTLARPYAKAVFEYAKAKGALNEWADFLYALRCIVSNDKIGGHLLDPNVKSEARISLLIDLASQWKVNESENFLRLLDVNNRIMLIPTIEQIFNTFKSDEENTLRAIVSTAYEMDESDKLNFETSLKKRFNQSFEVTYKVQKELIGGVLINVNDRIIDASLLGKLNKLNDSLRA